MEKNSSDNTSKINRRGILKEIRNYLILLIIAFTLVFAINKYVVVNAVVPTESMVPTVEPGNRFLVNRLAFNSSAPKRGDIVMFHSPDEKKKDFMKRIIGLPGETVTIKKGLVYIDDSQKPLKEAYLNDPPQGDYGPYKVPADSYFMLGDNRDYSNDARFWNHKFVKGDKIIGKVFFRYYPGFSVIKSAVY